MIRLIASFTTFFGIDFLDVLSFLAYPLALLAVVLMIFYTAHEQGGFV